MGKRKTCSGFFQWRMVGGDCTVAEEGGGWCRRSPPPLDSWMRGGRTSSKVKAAARWLVRHYQTEMTISWKSVVYVFFFIYFFLSLLFYLQLYPTSGNRFRVHWLPRFRPEVLSHKGKNIKTKVIFYLCDPNWSGARDKDSVSDDYTIKRY